jgi:hypothetical protein
MDPCALYDSLNCLSAAVLLLEDGSPERAGHAEASLLEASVAAAGAFPEGSPEARALGTLLGAVTRMAAAPAGRPR